MLVLSWLFGVATPNLKVFVNIIVIVLGVTIACLGEVTFSWIGFLFQLGGIFSEGVRLILIQILLSGKGMNMDPLVSLYYYAPVCTVLNALIAIFTEHGVGWDDVQKAGPWVLIGSAGVAFALNVASVFLVRSISLFPLVFSCSRMRDECFHEWLLTRYVLDWQDIKPSNDSLRRTEKRLPYCNFSSTLGHGCEWDADFRIRYCVGWIGVLWCWIRGYPDLWDGHDELCKTGVGGKAEQMGDAGLCSCGWSCDSGIDCWVWYGECELYFLNCDIDDKSLDAVYRTQNYDCPSCCI